MKKKTVFFYASPKCISQVTNLAQEDAAIVGQVLVVEVNVLLHRENLKMLWGVPGMMSLLS